MSIANQDRTAGPFAHRGDSEGTDLVHHQHTSPLLLGRCGLAILVAAVTLSCSAGEGSSALQPASASAAPVSRTANGKETLGSGGAASKPVSGVAPTPTAPTQRPEAAFDPLAFAPAADAGASSAPPSPSASPDPGTPPGEEDDDDEDDDEDDDDEEEEDD